MSEQELDMLQAVMTVWFVTRALHRLDIALPQSCIGIGNDVVDVESYRAHLKTPCYKLQRCLIKWMVPTTETPVTNSIEVSATETHVLAVACHFWTKDQ